MSDDVRAMLSRIKSETDIFSQAKLIAFLHREKQLPIKEIAAGLNYTSAYVCHLIRLNRVPEMVRDGYYSKIMKKSHLLILSRLKTGAQMIALYEKIVSQNFTVTQTEMAVREQLYGLKTVGSYLPREVIEQMRQQIRRVDPRLDLSIKQSRIHSKLTVEIKGTLESTTPLLKRLIGQFQTWIQERKE